MTMNLIAMDGPGGAQSDAQLSVPAVSMAGSGKALLPIIVILLTNLNLAPQISKLKDTLDTMEKKISEFEPISVH